MKELGDYTFDNNPLTARAYLFAGLANRWLAENFCYVVLGDWSQAVANSAQVPTDFVFNASYSLNSSRERNEIVFESHNRAEMSVFGTFIETLGPDGDPRTSWKDCTTPGTCASGHQGAGDADNPNYQQMKFQG